MHVLLLQLSYKRKQRIVYEISIEGLYRVIKWATRKWESWH